jgi:hypothetical protein
LTPDQVDVLHGAIPAATQLKRLDSCGCEFANDGSLEQILLACTKVENMQIRVCIYLPLFRAFGFSPGSY